MAGVLIAPTFNTLAAQDFFNLVVVAIAAAAVGRLVSLPLALVGGLGLGHLHRAVRHLPAAVVGRLHVARADPGQHHAGHAVRGPVRRAGASTRPSVGAARSPIRCRGSTRRPRRWPPSPGRRVPHPGHADLRRRVLRDRRLRGVHPGRRPLAVPHHPGGDPLHDLPLDHRDHRVWPGRSRCARARSPPSGASPSSSSPIATTCRCWPARCIGARASPAIVAALAVAPGAPPRRDLGGHRHPGVRLLLRLRHGEVLAGSAAASTRCSRAPGCPDRCSGRGTSPTTGPSSCCRSIVLVIASVAVIQIRQGTVGQTLQALRGSELAAQSIGISVGRARLIAFAVSGFIAGLGGAMLSIHQENVNYTSNFAPFAALFWLVLVVTPRVAHRGGSHPGRRRLRPLRGDRAERRALRVDLPRRERRHRGAHRVAAVALHPLRARHASSTPAIRRAWSRTASGRPPGAPRRSSSGGGSGGDGADGDVPTRTSSRDRRGRAHDRRARRPPTSARRSPASSPSTTSTSRSRRASASG